MAEPLKTFGFADLLEQDADPDSVAQLLDLESDMPEVGTREGAMVPGDGSDTDLKISEDNRKKLGSELADLLSEHDEMMRSRWERDSKVEDAYALMESTQQGGTYPGAAQMGSEMTMSAVDQAKARIAGSILGVSPIIKVDPIESSTFRGDTAVETAKAAEDFLDNYGKDVLKVEDIINLAVLRATKIGTTVLYTNWKKCIEKYKTYGQSGKILTVDKDTSRVQIDMIRNQDVVLWPPWIQDWQAEYEVVGHRSQLTVSQFRVKAKQLGLSEEVRERVERFSNGTQVKEDRQDSLNREGIDARVVDQKGFIDVVELWCNRLLPEAEMPEKFQVILHEGLREVLWIDYNRLHSQKHPYFPIRYKKVDGSAFGMGLGHEIVYCQAMDGMLRNLMADNLLSTSFPAVLLKSGTMADALMDRPYPGIRVPTEDPSGDINVVSFATAGRDVQSLLFGASQENEARKTNASGLAQVLSGQGDPTLKSGAGTGSTMALIEQAGKKFGDVDATIRSDWTPVCAMVLDLVAQFAATGVYYTKTSDENASILKTLSYVPVQGMVSDYFRIRAHAPSASNNKEMAKQSLLVVDQFMMQRVQMLAQMAQPYYQAVNPAGYPEFLGQCIKVLNYLGEKVLEAHEVPGTKGLLPEPEPPSPEEEQINQLTQQLQTVTGQLQQMQQQAQMQAQQAAMPPGMPPEGMPPDQGPPPEPPQQQMPMPGMA